MNRKNRPIFMFEDSDEDFEATVSAIRLAQANNAIVRCSTGRQALNYLHQRAPFTFAVKPVLSVMDLNFPGVDGSLILAEIRKTPWLSAVAVVVLSTSGNPSEIRLCYQLGAAGYLIKPVDLEKFEQQIRALADYWSGAVVLPFQEDFGYA